MEPITMIISVNEKGFILLIYSNHHPPMSRSYSAFSFKDQLTSDTSNRSWLWVKE